MSTNPRVPKSLTVTRDDLRVTYTSGRGVAIYRAFGFMGGKWTRVAWFISPESAECYLPRGWEDWPTLLADFTARREQERVKS
jgi:hypothetical protein